MAGCQAGCSRPRAVAMNVRNAALHDCSISAPHSQQKCQNDNKFCKASGRQFGLYRRIYAFIDALAVAPINLEAAMAYTIKVNGTPQSVDVGGDTLLT
jgi:hypothetical protein